MPKNSIPEKRKAGKCHTCGYVIKLRTDGTVGGHRLYGGIRWAVDSQYMRDVEAEGRIYHDNGSYTCEGTGKLPR